MGVDTKGFVLTADKDVMRVSRLVQNSLDALIGEELRIMFPNVGDRHSSKARSEFRTCRLELNPELDGVSVDFVFRGRARRMLVFFTCDCDHTEYGPKSLSLSLGCHGESGLFMQCALHALTLLGDAYYDENDCDGVDPVLLKEPRVTVLGAVALGYIRTTQVETWIEDFDRKVVGRGLSFEEFFGVPEQRLRQAAATSDLSAKWGRFTKMANSLGVPAPSFLNEYHERECARTA